LPINEKGIEVEPSWSLISFFTRHQVFPAHKTIEVIHEYVPLEGSSIGGNLSADSRTDDESKAYFAKYCINTEFFAEFDQKIGPLESPLYVYIETWLSYILKSGANWHGPIKDFRLIIHKESADTMMSTCIDGLKKIGPTLYEVHKTNFEPKKDIEILLVNWHRRYE